MSILPRIYVSDDHGDKRYFLADEAERFSEEEIYEQCGSHHNGLVASYIPPLNKSCWSERGSRHGFTPFGEDTEWYGWWGVTSEVPLTEIPEKYHDQAWLQFDGVKHRVVRLVGR